MATEQQATGIGSAEAVLRAALGSMPYGFSIWGEDRRLVLWNQHYEQMYRYPPGALQVGLSLFEICELTVAVGNHPGFTPERLHAIYQQRLDEASDPLSPLQAQKAIRGQVIKTSHVRSPGIGWIITHEDVTQEVEGQWMADLREKALADQNMRFDAALAHMPHGLTMYDGEWRLVICNQRYREMYDMPPELTRVGTPFQKIINYRRSIGATPVDGELDYVDQVLEATRAEGTRIQTYRMPNGKVISVHQSPMPNGGFVAMHQDITRDIERMEALEASRNLLANQNMRFEAAVNNMSQGLCMFDSEERLVICNAPYAAIYTLPPELVAPGTTLTEILEYRFEHGSVPKLGREAYVSSRRKLVTDRSAAKEDVEMEDGRIIAIQHHPMADGGWVATHEDITEQRQIEARVRHLARHDALTDLPNRVLLREEMEKLEARIQRQECVAVFCLDLDHFKSVNDTLGHGVGDKVLVEVAERLRKASRETDIVARLGGDEFAILVQALDGPRGASALAERIVRSVALPIEVDGHQIQIGTSIGIAVAPVDGKDAETLLKHADMALYRAKGEGRGNYHFFEPGMDEAMQHRRLLEQGLKVALERGQFRLVYQPLVSLADNRVCCLEALLRWDHPERGLISPMEFIPVAEETGAIAAIGDWVLHEACRAATAWPEHVRIAVNLSPVQFKKPGLVASVTEALAAAGLPAHRLELEITETLLLAETETTLATLHRLRDLGVRISMDDFGTGYSSLSYLRAFPFDKIKIDRSFMNELTPQQDSVAIIKAVIGLGQSLGMATTAEGIETEEQLAVVREQGCSEVQGFLFSPPLPASGVDALLGTLRPDRKIRRREFAEQT
ncbi:MAG TPA: PAS-domain containing protein [Devosiaceae bacterium]|jgi:diguanylate cyclase (GGDEF)-like protein|nr:PAS-domain containing protein [Devosiaceae bacterium]